MINQGALHVSNEFELPVDVTDAWRNAHFASQAASELAKSWGNEASDDSHSSLEWIRSGNVVGLQSDAAVGDTPYRARLDVASLVLSVNDGDRVIESFACDGRTLDDAMSWIAGVCERELGPRRQPARPAPDLPEHALATGGSFNVDAQALGSLASMYDVTAQLLDRLREVVPSFGDARCWPHHFDLASLAVVATDDAGAMTRTIGVGVTPPDSVNASGYWYVSPWSRDGFGGDVSYPRLSAGEWFDRGSGNAMGVLSVREVCTASSPGAVIADFVQEACNACLEVLA